MEKRKYVEPSWLQKKLDETQSTNDDKILEKRLDEYKADEYAMYDQAAGDVINGGVVTSDIFLSKNNNKPEEGSYLVWNPDGPSNKDDYTMTTQFLKNNSDYQNTVTFLDFLSDDECDELIDFHSFSLKKNPETIYNWEEKIEDAPDNHLDKDEIQEFDRNWRKSKNLFLQPYQIGFEWVYTKLDKIIRQANDKYFKFDMPYPSIIEPLQLTYYPPNGVYEWHTDWHGPNNPMGTRKISFVVQLSDPDDYTGGDLELSIHRKSEFNFAPKQRGSVTLFPSFVRHRLNTVQSGNRYSLVGWSHGNFWR